MSFTQLITRRPACASFVAGALFSLCFAPFYVAPLVFVCVPALLMLTRHARCLRHALRNGFLFGYGFFMAGTYWIAFSLLVDADTHAWLVPFSVLGLSALLALYFVPLGWLMYKLRQRPLPIAALLFIVGWVGLEWLRGQGMLGFPWNLAGYIIGVSNELSQLVAYVGIYGASAVVLLLALLPWVGWHVCKRKWSGVVLAALLLVVAYVAGGERIPAEVAYSDATIRVVQPNIEQHKKWTPEGKIITYQRLRALSTEGEERPEIVVWPETAIPALMYRETNWQHLLDKFVPQGAVLLSGILREAEDGKLYNSVVAVADNMPPAYYDKHQLVPFGEFVPMGEWLGFLPIAKTVGGFSRGNGAQTLTLPNGSGVSPLICYEAVFTQHGLADGRKPDWVLNVTNDAWFGYSPGPFQHAEMVRFRAIEYGLPVVRAANTGISMIVDPYGRVLKQLRLNELGQFTWRLPKPITY